MADPGLKSFLIDELSKGNLSVNGTLRVLQARYDEALQNETDLKKDSSVIGSTVKNVDEMKATNKSSDDESSFWKLDLTKSVSENSLKEMADKSVESEKVGLTKQDFVQSMNEYFNKILKQRAMRTGENVLDLAISEFERNKNNIGKTVISNEFERNEINAQQNLSNESAFNNFEKNHEKSPGVPTNTRTNKKSSCKVYIGNLPYSVTEGILQRHCEQYGNVLQVVIPRKSKRSRGFSFVYFEFKEDAERCIRVLHNTNFNGRRLRVEKARDQKIISNKVKMRQEKARKKKEKEERKKKLAMEQKQKLKKKKATKNKGNQQCKKKRKKKSVPIAAKPKKKTKR